MPEHGPDGAVDAKRLFLEQDALLETRSGGLFGELALLSVRSPIKLGANEDGALLHSFDARRAVIAVADGVGGQPSARQASRIALETLQRALEQWPAAGGTVREAILVGVERANEAVMEQGEGSATTIAVVELDGDFARSYHVGDSGVLAFDAGGRIRLRTIAHSPVGYAIEAGVLDELEAIDHGERHLVSNVVGDAGLHVDMSSALRLAPTDTLLVATDGLFDNFHVMELVQRLRLGPLDRAARALAAECRERMLVASGERPSKPDDLTLIALRPASRGA